MHVSGGKVMAMRLAVASHSSQQLELRRSISLPADSQKLEVQFEQYHLRSVHSVAPMRHRYRSRISSIFLAKVTALFRGLGLSQKSRGSKSRKVLSSVLLFLFHTNHFLFC